MRYKVPYILLLALLCMEKLPAADDAPAPTEIKFDATFLRELKDLGAPQLERRKAILEKIKQVDQTALQWLLAMLDPKQDTDEYTRVGICRALIEMAPLSEQAAQTLAFCAARDRYPEVRREACRSIRELQEDRAVRQLIQYSSSQDARLRYGAAAALREIDDNRVFETLVRAIPKPEVIANMGELKNTDPKYLPIGPGGARLPIFLPKQDVAGTSGNIDSPAAELLKLIAGKDLGNNPMAWLNWYREKNGDITRTDRESLRERRSVLGR